MRTFFALLALCWFSGSTRAEEGTLRLNTRTKLKLDENGRFGTKFEPVEWKASETAIIVCDMWDKHWCSAATERVGQMAPRMNEVLKSARNQGVFIIHCPSDTMNFYKDFAQRKLAQAAPKVETKVPLGGWCRLNAEREPALPIDDSDGGCDSGDPGGNPWRRQIETLEIFDEDAITDNAEAYYLMRARGIKNVIVMGVHTNMCVLGRPFSIRQMSYLGQNVVLMRDMTDTMYNPAKAPFVSHFTGTDLVIEHIEKYWCPSITSSDFVEEAPFQFPGDKRKRLVILCSEDEYKTELSLPKFTLNQLGNDFQVEYCFQNPKDENGLIGLESLARADLLLVSMRRRVLPEADLKLIQDFVQSGKPVVGIRTASHAFHFRDGTIPEGRGSWPLFDKEILGGNYQGHRENNLKVTAQIAQLDHAVLSGIAGKSFPSAGSLYQVLPLAKGTTVLATGKAETIDQKEPLAWARTIKNGARVFYTSLGHTSDFENELFQRLLRNGIYWAAGLEVPESFSVGSSK